MSCAQSTTPLFDDKFTGRGCAAPGAAPILVSSGSEALFHLFARSRFCGKRVAYVSAYTCPEIVTAALCAGLEVCPVDCRAGTLEPLFPEDIDPARGLLVLSNLYGFAEALPRPLLERGVVVIDDACQAALTRRKDGIAVGFSPETHGVWSFGRGKAICAFGGGAFRDRNTEVTEQLSITGGLVTGGLLPALSRAAVLRLLSHPFWFGIISRLPGTGIGGTHTDLQVELGALKGGQVLAARAKISELESEREIYRRNALRWQDILLESKRPLAVQIDEGTVPIRYPLLCESRSERDSLLRRTKRYGCVISYPRSIPALCGKVQRVIKRDCPNADLLAEQLLTLPVHPGVPQHVFESVRQLFLRAV